MISLNSENIHLTKGQLLKKAEKHIAQMEEERTKGMEHLKTQAWQIAQLRMAVTALCLKFNVSTDQCKEIYNAFCEEEDKKIIADQLEQVEAAKKKMVEDIKAGKKVEFTAMDRSAG